MNLTSVEDYDTYYDEDMDGSRNACQAHNDPVDPGSDAMTEKKLRITMTTLDNGTIYEAAELDAIALLADTWNDDLVLEVSAQLVQASAQAYFSFGKDKGIGKGKSKGKGKGRYPVRPSHLSLEDRRRRLRELKAKTECRACGRKGHWANDRECAMSSSSSTQNQTRTARMATRQQLTDRADQIGACFVLNEYCDDPTETTEQVPLTPTASAAFDTKDTATFNTCVTDDNDEIWAIEADHRTGWDKTFKSGTSRGLLYARVLRACPKQVVSMAKAKSVPTDMREFLCWAQRHYRIDVTASTEERNTGGLASAGTCPGG